MLATSINYAGLPPVAPAFDAAALRANILDSQRHGQRNRPRNDLPHGQLQFFRRFHAALTNAPGHHLTIKNG